MIQAVIFDLDGLLVDSERYWDQARQQMAAEAGKDWNVDDHRATMGVSTRVWANYMIRRLELPLSPEEVESRIIGKMLELYRQGIPYLPGAIEAVDLAFRHYPTGLASGSPQVLIDAVTNDTPIRDKFKAVVCSDRLPRGKPAPDVYLEAAHQLGTRPERCICLEDSGNGILAGKAAGMKVIAVPDPRFPPPQTALTQVDLQLASLCEFSLQAILALEPSG